MLAVSADKENNETASGNSTANSFCSIDNLPSPTQKCGVNDGAEDDSPSGDESTSEVI